MKSLILLCVLAAAGAAQAVSGPISTRDARTMTCADLRNDIRSEGTLLITRGGRWGQVVKADASCDVTERPVFTYVRASDGNCGLGYTCEFYSGN